VWRRVRMREYVEDSENEGSCTRERNKKDAEKSTIICRGTE
jgi:hypothetical protein